MYLVNDTVEESIYDLSVTRRLSHIARKERGKNPDDEDLANNLTEAAIDSANSLEVQYAALAKLMAGGASGGELVKKDDLWQCLFGRPNDRKEVNGHSAGAEREVARFLRGEAAEQRRTDMRD